MDESVGELLKAEDEFKEDDKVPLESLPTSA